MHFQPLTMSPVRLVFSSRIMWQSLVIALVVGTILCLINQGDALFAGKPLNIYKLALTYMVPFVVASYGSWNMARMSRVVSV
ncbi:hypothetical protein MNBD_ALPHA12-1129 [hydrothermal vent metagenome]|uniref:Uncharacterized protein n=1 Tax=hydrothermal vent metagenome TaxID=652676 RepID=A0A3B0TR05_9ZZZZ